MLFTKRQWAAIGLGFVVAVGYVVWERLAAPAALAPAEVTATSTPLATSTIPAPAPAVGPFPINAADTLTSWSFTGAYAGNAALTKQAEADIDRLSGLLGEGQYDDYDLYLGIGNDRDLLGDGKGAYQAYNRATAIHPKKGLAYTNLGHLFDQLGGYHTAADAYAKATAVEPGVLTYHQMRLSFLTMRFPKDTARITAALADSVKVFGDTAPILAIEARWLSDVGRYADAIKAWETAKMLSPGKDTTAIDAEIARLQAKL